MNEISNNNRSDELAKQKDPPSSRTENFVVASPHKNLAYANLVPSTYDSGKLPMKLVDSQEVHGCDIRYAHTFKYIILQHGWPVLEEEFFGHTIVFSTQYLRRRAI